MPPITPYVAQHAVPPAAHVAQHVAQHTVVYVHENQTYQINAARIPADMAKFGINYEQAVILQAIQQLAKAPAFAEPLRPPNTA